MKEHNHMLSYGTSRLGLFTATLSIVMAAEASTQLMPDWVQRSNLAFLDEPAGIVIDDTGAIYVTGRSGPSVIEADIVTIKYAPDGTETWVATYDGPSQGVDLGKAIAIDSAGDILVLGLSESVFLVIKYDASDGSIIGTMQHDPGGIDRPNAFTTDDAGNIYVTGQSWLPGSDDENDFYTLKMDTMGKVLWTARYNGPGPFLFAQDIAVDIALDSNGDVFVTGPSSATSGTEDYVTIKYRGSDGAELWLDRYAGAGANDIPVDLVIDLQDNVYVTGSSFQSGWKYATIKYRNSDGERLWVALDDPGTKDFASSLALDSQGDVYVAGRSDPDGDDGNFNENVVVARHRASDGAQLWMTIYGENGFNDGDLAFDIVVDDSNSVYITGQTSSFKASNDLLVLRYDAASGEVLDEGVFEGETNEIATGLGMALDADQNVIVIGVVGNGCCSVGDILTLKYPGQTQFIPGDLDEDGQVGVKDLLILLGDWGPCPPKGDCPADLDGDGSVGVKDLLILLGNWG